MSSDSADLTKSLASRRSFMNVVWTIVTGLLTLFTMIPLFAVLYMLISHGIGKLGVDAFTKTDPTIFKPEGGFGHAMMGTLMMVGIASLISIPFGICTGIYLAEFGKQSKTANFIRFSVKVLTGLPSILAGVFAYAVVVLTMGNFSALAGGVALSILYIPIVVLTAEESLKAVPQKMRDAAFGMGATRSQVVLKIVVPTAASGLVTGIMLGIARAAGETAPLLFTALYASSYADGINEPTASLSVFIYKNATQDSDELLALAWTAALVLVFIVLALNVLAQILTRQKHKER